MLLLFDGDDFCFCHCFRCYFDCSWNGLQLVWYKTVLIKSYRKSFVSDLVFKWIKYKLTKAKSKLNCLKQTATKRPTERTEKRKSVSKRDWTKEIECQQKKEEKILVKKKKTESQRQPLSSKPKSVVYGNVLSIWNECYFTFDCLHTLQVLVLVSTTHAPCMYCLHRSS